ncbi:hypothetical protein SARC_05856 [Sphaeroforma arctica JP610]|uniref:Replication protein A subunit n=1 Tax=Sphaeroforma arctica JP610 TaxID=667725 RepID=A0A0L0FZ35_9EUKA|nr:hypothetical protein SARC_05856 [Sphaeroforma arctica JP610]KNC81836.1 hypothetical protein SARC_05856 [Sphaeroforma arctica JP610]|eukprot:XP_014155738.1 hypothetical protein SARC_05856 [Sphaeroforma arctica JP610]
MDLLTELAIPKIYAEEGTGEANAMVGCKVQIVTMKKVQPTSNKTATERWRLCISDGKWFLAAMLATQLNNMVNDGHIKKGTILMLNNYLCNTVRERKIAILLDVTVESNEHLGIIGDPQNYDPVSTAAAQSTQNAQNAPVKSEVKPNPPMNKPQPSYNNNNNNSSYNNNNNMINNTRVTPSPSRGGGTTVPIKSLNCYQNRWSIKGRCVMKGDYRHWNNDKGSGKLISFNLKDTTGTIKMTGFNEVAETIMENIQSTKVYTISGGEVKFANQRYNTTGHQCEVTLNKSSVITEMPDDEAPGIQYNFEKIGNINDQVKDATVDVIGVISVVNDCVNIRTRAGGDVTKRDMTLIDDSNKAINITLWGATATDFDKQEGSILAVSNARVGDYNGRTLSASRDSMVLSDPNIPDAHRLRGWYDKIGKNTQVESLSAGGVGGAQRWDDERITLGGISSGPKLEQLQSTSKPLYFITSGYIDVIKKENFIYNACPDCNKKISEQGSGYHCENCSKDFSEASKRLMLSMCLYDTEGNTWATAFHETAQDILGISAEDLYTLSMNDPDAFEAKMNDAKFRHLLIKLRAKMDTYNDESRVRCNISAVKAIDYLAESKRMLSEIKQAGFA